MKWVPVDNNCGTGAGGFKPGNDCAKSKTRSFVTKRSLMQGLSSDLPNMKVSSTLPNSNTPASSSQNVFHITQKTKYTSSTLSPVGYLKEVEAALIKNGFTKTVEINHEPKPRFSGPTREEVPVWERPLWARHGPVIPNELRESYRTYVHPDGHAVDVHSNIYYSAPGTPQESSHGIMSNMSITGYYIPSRHRNAAILSQEALDTGALLHKYVNTGDTQQELASVRGLRHLLGSEEYGSIIRHHEYLYGLYTAQSNKAKSEKEKQAYNNAAELHGVAADYYKDIS